MLVEPALQEICSPMVFEAEIPCALNAESAAAVQQLEFFSK